MIDYVLKLTGNSLLHYQQLTLLDVVDSYHVSQWDVTEDKLEPHGLGSKIPELFQEEISEIVKPVIHIPCNNVLTTLIQPLYQDAPMLNKLIQLAAKLALETTLIMLTINTKLLHHTH